MFLSCVFIQNDDMLDLLPNQDSSSKSLDIQTLGEVFGPNNHTPNFPKHLLSRYLDVYLEVQDT